MKKSLIAICIIAACSLLTVSLLLNIPSAPSEVNPQTTPQSTPSILASDPALQQAIENAIIHLNQTRHPIGLMMLDTLYRQFNITEFKDSLHRYDQQLQAKSDPMTRLWRRIADCNNPVEPSDFDAVTDQLDRLTVPALYADRTPLPDDYLTRLICAFNMGLEVDSSNSAGYLLTHSLLAVIWLQNNNCDLQLPEGYIDDLYQANAVLIGDGTVVNDLQLEAAAFLYQAGQGNLVNPDFAENVVDAQYSDGGWAADADSPSSTDWHPSVLALMLLLHVRYPAECYPPMLAAAPNLNQS